MEGSLQVVLDAPQQPVSRIPIAKLGEYSDKRYGDFQITRGDIESWRSNLSKLPGGRALIDLDHRADRSPRNTEAAGWITGIAWDGETPVADVEWTPVGRQAIEEQRYLFFSPTYGPLTTETGTEIDNVLQGGALTNKPFLTSMPALTLASQEAITQALDDGDQRGRLLDVLTSKARNDLPDSAFALSGREYPIHDLSHARNALARVAQHGTSAEQAQVKAAVYRRYPELKPGNDGDADDKSDSRQTTMDTEVLTALDLGEDTDVAAAVAKIRDLKAAATPKPSRNGQRTLDTQLLTQLGLREDTDAEEALTAIKELQARADVPRRSLAQRAADNGKVLLDQAAFDDLRERTAAGERAKQELREQTFDIAFTRALEGGRAVPEQRENFEKFYELDANHTLAMLNEGPRLVNVRSTGWDNGAMVLSDAPPGVEENSHMADQKVKAKLRKLGKSMNDFHVVFEQMMKDGEI